MKKLLVFTSFLLFLILSSCGVLSIPSSYSPVSLDSDIYEKYDEFRNVTFYQHKTLFPTMGIKSSIVGYVVKHSEGVIFRTQFNYFSLRTQAIPSKWIFFDRVIIMNPDLNLKLELNLNSYDSKRDVTSSGVSESYDIILNETEYNTFKMIFKTGVVKCAYYGDGLHEFEYSERGKKAIREIINFYENLNQ